MPRTYVTPYRGPVSSLPPGYMQAATAPGRNLAAGMMSLGGSIADGLQQMQERQQAEQEKQKSEAAEFKALQKYAKAAGYADADQTTTMDLPRLKGFVRAKEGETIRAEQKAKLADFARRNATNDAMRDLLQAKAVTMGGLQPHQTSNILQNNPAAAVADVVKFGQALADKQAVQPQAHDLNNDGVPDFVTLGDSMQPMPRAQSAIGQSPKVSPDGKFFHDGNSWKPIRDDKGNIDASVLAMLMGNPELQSQYVHGMLGGASAPSGTPSPEAGGSSEMWKKFESGKW